MFTKLSEIILPEDTRVGFKHLSILSLSGFVITFFLVYEDGPFGLFKWIRFFAGINVLEQELYHDGRSVTPLHAMKSGIDVELVSNESTTANIVSCHRCSGAWVGLLLSLPFIRHGVLFVTAVMGAVVFLCELIVSVSRISNALLDMMELPNGSDVYYHDQVPENGRVEV